MEENRAKACCGFGHKDVFQNINESLENAVLLAVKSGCEIFYTGAMGDFDNLFSCAVRKAKKIHPNIKLICVKPYMTQDINNNGDFLFSLYDDIIIPPEITGIHYKSAITKRNRWIIAHSDIIISYTIRTYVGAYTAVKYARSLKKDVIEIEI